MKRQNTRTRWFFTLLTVLGLLALPWMGTASADGSPVFLSGPDMNVERMGHHIATLPDGRVVVFGGHGTDFVALGSAEIWDPSTNTFSRVDMNYVHDGSAFVKLSDGRYLIAGGAADWGIAPGYNHSEIYKPSDDSFTPTSPMNYPRMNCNAALLSGGQALIVGGWYDNTSATYGELFNPATGTYTVTGPMNTPRSSPLVLPTSDNKAVILGGGGVYGDPSYFEQVELYDPVTNTFEVVRESLFDGETGWVVYGVLSNGGRSIEAQRLADGRYLYMASKVVDGVSQSTLFTFNPVKPIQEAIQKFATTPALIDSSVGGLWGPVVDTDRNRAILPSYLHPYTNPLEVRLYVVELSSGAVRALPPYTLPNDWFLGSNAYTVLPDHRIFFTGGNSTNDWYYNFYPVKKTLFGIASDLAWYNEMGQRATWSAPVAVRDRVIVQFQDGGVGCYKASDGTELWVNPDTQGSVASPVYQRGMLYLVGRDTLYEIDPEQGDIKRTYVLPNDEFIISKAPAVSQTMVYLSSFSTFYAIELSTLEPVWTLPVGKANAMLEGDIVYVAADKLYALNAIDGSELWNAPPPQGPAFQLGALAGDFLVVFSEYDFAAQTSTLHAYQLAVDRSSAPTLLWSASMGKAYSDDSPPAMGGGKVYATSREGVLRAFALNGNGTPLWERTVRPSGLAPALPIAVDGKVFIHDMNNLKLLGLNGGDGSLFWESDVDIPGIAWGSPSLLNGRIFLALDGGAGLYALDVGNLVGNWYMFKHNPDLTGSDNGWTPEQSVPKGNLIVTINPQAVIDAGAKWRVDGGEWQDGGQLVQGLATGEHTVDFMPVPGWTVPDPLTVEIVENETTEAEGTYVERTGCLLVTIEPWGAVEAGAKWKVGDGEWQESGAKVEGLPVGLHHVEFNEIVGWTTPSPVDVEILEGETATVTGSYLPTTGSLVVMIVPPGAVNAGAQWNVDDGELKSSGETVDNLSADVPHTVRFTEVEGWTKPVDQEVSIIAGGIKTIRGTYVRNTGALKVTIFPEGAIGAGARWKVDAGAWQTSETVLQSLTVGVHTVSFKTVLNWIKPVNQTVVIEKDQMAEATGTYEPQTGSLKVLIVPPKAVAAGAKWKVDEGEWLESGTTVEGLSVFGGHVVQFSGVPGWVKPGDQTVTVKSGQTTTVTGNYTQQKGKLVVTILPQAAVNAGARWKVDNGVWQTSGKTLENLTPGSHTVVFKDVTGWTTPESVVIQVVPGGTVKLTGTYVLEKGALQVALGPPAVVNAGAMWKVDNGVWKFSGATVKDLSPGRHVLKFKAITGWKKPADRTVNIVGGQTTIAKGIYMK